MGVQKLLDFIGKYESRNNPDAVWGGIKAHDKSGKPITSMTVGEVLAWQDSIDNKYMSEASGEWQFMEDTLRDLYRQAGVSINDEFNRNTQIKLATALLKRRGLDDYMDGRISAEKFAHNLSKEWASMPRVLGRNDKERQSSYYAGDGLNAAHASVSDFMDAVRNVKDAKPAPKKTGPAIGIVGAVGATGAAVSSGVPVQYVVAGVVAAVIAAAIWWAMRRRK